VAVSIQFDLFDMKTWNGIPCFGKLVVDDYEVIVVLYNEPFGVLFRVLDIDTQSAACVEATLCGFQRRCGWFGRGFGFLC
jgi:hypothetical protein